MLEKEFEYYRAHQGELVQKYEGKVIVIRGIEVIGVFDDELTAVLETAKSIPLGSFLVQRVEPGSDSYTQVYHSRVAVA